MPEPTFSLTADDDLPRTIRREREARERQARERQAAAAPAAPLLDRDAAAALEMPSPAPVSVVAVDMPFARLAMFFMRCVFAAIPALVLLTAILWVFGHTLQLFFPQLLKMKILIYMP
jgi:hypothetical protein